MDLRDHLLTMERALAARDPSLVDRALIDLIAPDFVELGASGRVWDRSSIRTLLESRQPSRVVMEEPDVAVLGEDVVLVTYRLDGARRSSVWVRRDGRWHLRFHQGTRAPANSSVGPDERSSE